MSLLQCCVIALVGYKQHGKGEVARALVEREGYVLVKFADPLKQMLRAMLRSAGIDEATIERMIEGDLKEEPCDAFSGRSPRFAMLTLGTEWGRHLMSMDLWINIARLKVISILKQGRQVVIDDCRFPNELALVGEFEGSIIRVHRTMHPVDYSHESERYVPELSRNAAATIFNDGTVEQLRTQAIDTLNALRNLYD